MGMEKWSEDIWVVRPGDEPGLSEDLLGAHAEMIDAATAPNLVVDFAAVSHLNSSNLSQLLRLRKVAIDRDVRLRLSGVNDSLWTLFLHTGLDKVFEFTENVPTALASLQLDARQ